MDRREALRLITLFAGGSIAVPAYAQKVLQYPDEYWQVAPDGVQPDDTKLLAALADTLLPPSKSPGASAAGVQHILPVLVKDCLEKEQQTIFWEGLQTLNEQSREEYKKAYADLDLKKRTQLLQNWEQTYIKERNKPDAPDHFFKLAKDLSIIGYFTSEIGATQALQYLAVPGQFKGDIPLEPGQKAWFK